MVTFLRHFILPVFLSMAPVLIFAETFEKGKTYQFLRITLWADGYEKIFDEPNRYFGGKLHIDDKNGTVLFTISNYALDELIIDADLYFSEEDAWDAKNRFLERLAIWKVKKDSEPPEYGKNVTMVGSEGPVRANQSLRMITLKPKESFSISDKIWDIEGERDDALNWKEFLNDIEKHRTERYELFFSVTCAGKLTINEKQYKGDIYIGAVLPVDYKTAQQLKTLQLKENLESMKDK
jgi:hypothetical protein